MGTYGESSTTCVREVSRTVHDGSTGESVSVSTEEKVPVQGRPILCNEHKCPPYECFPSHWPQAFSGRAQDWSHVVSPNKTQAQRDREKLLEDNT